MPDKLPAFEQNYSDEERKRQLASNPFNLVIYPSDGQKILRG